MLKEKHTWEALASQYQRILPATIKVLLQATAPLVDLISCSISEYPKQVQQEQRHSKATLHSKNHYDAAEGTEALQSKLTSSQLNAMEQASERASFWFTDIPMAKYGFGLHKLAFRDGPYLRLGDT